MKFPFPSAMEPLFWSLTMPLERKTQNCLMKVIRKCLANGWVFNEQDKVPSNS